MLFNLRGALDSIFVKALLGVLIAAFAIWGIGPGMLAGSTRIVAKVGETDVPTQQFANAVQRRATQLQTQFGGQMNTQEIIRLMNLDYQVLNQMVTDAAIEENLREMGFRATEAQLADDLRSFEAFQAPDGSFSVDMMERALQSAGFSKAELYADLRRNISREQLLNSMASTDLLPRAMAEQLFVWQAERRRASMINISASDITDIAEASEEELLANYEANKASYMTPERRSYRYVMLTPAQFTDKVDITEEDIAAAFETRRDEYEQPELRALQQVSFPTEEEAQAFLQQIAAGADFVEAGATATTFTAEEIDLGQTSRSDLAISLDQTTAEAVFALEEGATSQPLEGIAGWNIFKVTGITPGVSTTLADVRGELEAALREELAVDLMFDFLPDLEDAIAEDGALSPVANKLDLTLATVTSVDAQGKGPSGTQLVTQQNEYIVMQDAFRRDLGVEAQVTDLDPQDNTKGVYLVELTEVQEPAERAYEEVASQVRSAWETEERQRRAGEIAELAKTRLQAGEDPEVVAQELGGTSFDAKNVSRTAEGSSGLSQNIRRLIFELGVGTVDAERAADGNGYVVVRVNGVMPGEPTANPEAVDTLYAQLVEQTQSEVFEQYQSYLLDKYEPEIKTNIVQQLFRSDVDQ
ncbi:SurA N-terminal domain-containing protein [Kordiimonas sp.]|uniref:SurA N-terminal domain-containing protein n=1 Tax=Kordiimonas sp. TaxID=1970157 RepID=UPI003A8CCDEA